MLLWTLRFFIIFCGTYSSADTEKYTDTVDDTKSSVFKEVQSEVFHAISLPPEQRKLLPTKMQEHFEQELEKRAKAIISNTNMHTVTTGNPFVRQEIIMITGVMPNETMHFKPTLCVITKDANSQWAIAHTHQLTLPAITCQENVCSLTESSFSAHPNKDLPSVGGFFRYKSSSLGPDRFHHMVIRWDGHRKTYVISDQTSSLPLEPASPAPSKEKATKPEAQKTAKETKDNDANPTVIAPSFSTGGGASPTPERRKNSSQKKDGNATEAQQKNTPTSSGGNSAGNTSGSGGSGLSLPSLPKIGLPDLPKGASSVPKSLPRVPNKAPTDAPEPPQEAPTDAPTAPVDQPPVAGPEIAATAPEDSPLIPTQNLHLKGAGSLQELSAPQEFSIDLNTLTTAGL